MSPSSWASRPSTMSPRRLGLRYASIGPSMSLVWPPTGIALAALTALGLRYWPGIALGAFLANAATPIPLLAAAGIAAGNTLEALLGAYLLRRAAGHTPRFDEGRSVRGLVLMAAPLGALASALIGVATIYAAGEIAAGRIPATIAVWWTGDVLGALVVAPVSSPGYSPDGRAASRGACSRSSLLCLGTVIAAEAGAWPQRGSPAARPGGLPIPAVSVRHLGGAAVWPPRRIPHRPSPSPSWRSGTPPAVPVPSSPRRRRERSSRRTCTSRRWP